MFILSWKKKFTTYTLLATSVCITAHAINKFICSTAIAKNLLKAKENNYYSWRFGNIYYEKIGSGKPILLIHDLNTCSSSYEWHKLINKLSETNTVYTLDLLGCGRSEKPDFTYTDFLYVQLITDFIKNIIKEKTDVIATGESSAFTLMTASSTEDLIDKILLINPVNMVKLTKVPTAQTKLLKHLICFPIIGTLLYNLLITKKTIKETFQSEYFYNVDKITEKDIDTYFESAHLENTGSKYLFASMISRYTNANILLNLQKIKNSIFIITGDGNPENHAIAEIYQSELPSIEITGIKNTKHLPQLEKPEDVLEQIQILFDL